MCEIAVLRRIRVSMLTNLASAELDEPLPSSIPGTAHPPGGEERLRITARRAKLMISGSELERISDAPIVLPQSDIEIDFDIETSADDHVYRYGFFVTDTHSDEVRRRLRELVTTSGGSVRVFRYSRYEVLRIQRLAKAGGPTASPDSPMRCTRRPVRSARNRRSACSTTPRTRCAPRTP